MDIDLIQILRAYDSSEVDPDVRSLSKRYLEKYWLDLTLLDSYWLPIKNNIFNPDSKDLPELMFNEGFELIAQKSGLLFVKEEYLALQKCMKAAGDKYFVILENKFVKNLKGDHTPLRFIFPVETTWEELNNGDEYCYHDISSYDLILNPQKQFFVYGDSGKWGKYTANDYGDTPLEIIGFKQELSSPFRMYFSPSKEDKDEIREWLPSTYRNLIL